MQVKGPKPTRICSVHFIAKLLMPVLLVLMLIVSGCDTTPGEDIPDSTTLSSITLKSEPQSASEEAQPSLESQTSSEPQLSTETEEATAASDSQPVTKPEEIMSAPLFTYDEQNDELRAYYKTFDNGADYYTLSGLDEGKSGDYIYYTFSEYDLSLVFYFDADYSVWRVFNTLYFGEYEITSVNLESGYECTEYAVYLDCEDAVKNQENLVRVRAQETPAYRQWDNVLWYSFEYAYDRTHYLSRSPRVPIEIEVDVNKDGVMDALCYDVNRNITLNGGSKTYLLTNVSTDIYPIGVYVFDVNKEDSSMDFLFSFGAMAPGIDELAPSLWVRYDHGWIIKEIPFKQLCCVADNIITFTTVASFIDSRYITREFSADESYELTTTTQRFAFLEKFTVIAPMDAIFLDSDGTAREGTLSVGTVIETTETDYFSKVYFVTESGDMGYFETEDYSIIISGAEWGYYTDYLKSDTPPGYNLIP